MFVVIGNLSPKWKNWYSLHKTIYEGHKIETITFHFALNQLIKELTHTLENSFSSTDLIFTSQQQFGCKFRSPFFSLSSSNCICKVWFTNKLYPSPSHTNVMFGITKMLMLILTDVHLTNLGWIVNVTDQFSV